MSSLKGEKQCKDGSHSAIATESNNRVFPKLSFGF